MDAYGISPKKCLLEVGASKLVADFIAGEYSNTKKVFIITSNKKTNFGSLFSARRSRSGLLSALRPRRTSRQLTGNLLVNSQTHLTQSRYHSLYKSLSQRLQNKRYITWNSNSVGSNQDGQMAANFTTVGHPSQLVDY
jgi:hypothetical protein